MPLVVEGKWHRGNEAPHRAGPAAFTTGIKTAAEIKRKHGDALTQGGGMTRIAPDIYFALGGAGGFQRAAMCSARYFESGLPSNGPRHYHL